MGISGIPGAGKTTFANLVLQQLERLNSQSILIGLDGWHLTRAQLSAFPNPEEAHARRGAHWTFDAEGYVDFVFKLRDDSLAITTAPSFDHAVKDPVPEAFSVLPQHRIVIIEGLYAFLNVEPHWSRAAALLDHRIFLPIDFDIARARLAKRHVASGITETLEEGLQRAEQNDLPNGRFIIENMLEPTRTVVLEEDPKFEIEIMRD